MGGFVSVHELWRDLRRLVEIGDGDDFFSGAREDCFLGWSVEKHEREARSQ